MKELIPSHENGLLHQFDDVDRFPANLREVLDNPHYRSNASRCRTEIAQKFDWERIA